MQLTYAKLGSPVFQKAMLKVAACSSIKDLKTVYRFSKIFKAYNEGLKEVEEVRFKIIETYGEKDENGKLKPKDGQQGTFFIPEENRAEWEEKLKEFGELTFELKVFPLSFVHLESVGLSPMELDALDPVVVCTDLDLAALDKKEDNAKA